MTRLGELLGCVTIGVVAAVIIVVAASPPTPPPAPEPTPVTGQVPQGQALEDEQGEEDLWWNCLTEGNLECGPTYHPLTTGQVQAITIAHDGLDDWQGCLTDDVTVVCPDSYVYLWEWVPADLAA